jgi:hypothetical protein
LKTSGRPRAIRLIEDRRGAHWSLAARLYTRPGVCHFSPVRSSLLLCLCAAIACGGCATKAQRERKQAAAAERANSREIEERRLRAVDGRDIASKRGAEIFVADPHKKFDMSRDPLRPNRSYGTDKARVKDFAYDQKVNPSKFSTRDFYGSKSALAAEKRFATAEANTRGNYTIPNADKPAPTKTADTRDARESGVTAAVRELPSAHRPYLGKESEKVHTALDQNNLPRVSNELHELKTIDDVRELLNKNK